MWGSVGMSKLSQMGKWDLERERKVRGGEGIPGSRDGGKMESGKSMFFGDRQADRHCQSIKYQAGCSTSYDCCNTLPHTWQLKQCKSAN